MPGPLRSSAMARHRCTLLNFAFVLLWPCASAFLPHGVLLCFSALVRHCMLLNIVMWACATSPPCCVVTPASTEQCTIMNPSIHRNCQLCFFSGYFLGQWASSSWSMHTSQQPKIREEIHQLGVLCSIWRAQRITLAEDLVILGHICISPKASSSKTYSHVRQSEYLRQRKRNVLFCSFAMEIRNAGAVALKSS